MRKQFLSTVLEIPTPSRSVLLCVKLMKPNLFKLCRFLKIVLDKVRSPPGLLQYRVCITLFFCISVFSCFTQPGSILVC